jgi:release factor glutamine methyltransferase
MVSNIQTIKDIKPYLAGELARIYPDHEISALAGIIIKTVLKATRLHSVAYPESPVSQKHTHEIMRICRELKKGKPIQYILGETNFYNCTIKINNETLIPRPETEELVDLIIKENRGFSGSILDVGTGSGCIAVALAINLPGTTVTGTDNSEEALKVARENASINDVKADFIRSDILEPDISLFRTADIIVSNPPYIRESEKNVMKRNVLDYEPHSALFVPDQSPLIFYKAILNLADKILNPTGKIYFEINEAMGKQMMDLMISHKYDSACLIKDINGKERIIKAFRHGRI